MTSNESTPNVSKPNAARSRGSKAAAEAASTGSVLRDRLRAALREALWTRDSAALTALRSALAALDNAEAADVAEPAAPAVGVRAAEADRRELAPEEEARIVQAEIDERVFAAEKYEAAGQPDRAVRLRTEARILSGCLHAPS